MAGTKKKRDQFERLPLVIILATLGLIVSAPLGLKVQQHITTSGDPQGLAIVNIFPVRFGQFSIHRVDNGRIIRIKRCRNHKKPRHEKIKRFVPSCLGGRNFFVGNT